jgi:hypothetical protein
MGDIAKISPHVACTHTQNAILSVLIIYIIPSCTIYMAIDNSSLVSSISCLITSSDHWNYMHIADNVSHAEILKRNSFQGFSNLPKV